MLEKNLAKLLNDAFGDDARRKDALMLCRGFSGEVPVNNAQAAKVLGVMHSTHGNKSFTRERVRLLLLAAVGRKVEADNGELVWEKDPKGNPLGILPYLEASSWRSTKLEKAIALLESVAPVSADTAIELLKKYKLTEIDFHPSALIAVANTLEQPCQLAIQKYAGNHFVVISGQKTEIVTNAKGKTKQELIPDAILKSATKRVIADGACSVSSLVDLIPVKQGISAQEATKLRKLHGEFVRDLVETSAGCTWLDSDLEWFFFNRPCRNRVVTKLQQLFAVVEGELPTTEVVEAIDQSYKEYSGQTRVIPDDILISLTEIVADCRLVTRGRVDYLFTRSRESLQETLTEDMKHIVEFLSKNPMSREHAMREELVTKRGVISNPVLVMRIFYSPFTKRPKPGQYVLRGQQTPTRSSKNAKGNQDVSA